MKTTSDNKQRRTFSRHSWKSIGAFSVLTVVVMLAAFPLPVFFQKMRLEASIDELVSRKDRLPSLIAEVERLKTRVPPESEAAGSALEHQLPRVKSALNLRNLLLAQAQATGVHLQQLDFAEEALWGPTPTYLFNGSVLGQIKAQLSGSAELGRLMLFLGLLESTGLVYLTTGLEAGSISKDEESMSFSLDLEIFFQADPGLFQCEPVSETDRSVNP